MKIKKVKEYECDRCKTELEAREKITIFVQKKGLNYPKKEFDLCERCYIAMVKGIQKGREQKS